MRIKTKPHYDAEYLVNVHSGFLLGKLFFLYSVNYPSNFSNNFELLFMHYMKLDIIAQFVYPEVIIESVLIFLKLLI